MTVHSIETYKDAAGEERWRILIKGNKDIVADSGEGYKNRHDMLNSLFGIFFGTYDESYLTLYQEWNPEGNVQGVPSSEVVGDDIPPVEAQAGAEEYPDGRVGVPAPDGIHDGGVTDDD